MSPLQKLFLGLTAATIVTMVWAQGAAGGVDVVGVNCLGCLCEAATGCNRTRGCGGGVCGPFSITWAYWSDGGNNTINGENPSHVGAFENCVQDLYCAAKTVEGYMKKFGADCTGDGLVTCADMARIHSFGYNACGQPLRAEFAVRYEECSRRLRVQ